MSSVRIYYICECCDKVIKCVDCRSILPYEHEMILDDADGDIIDNSMMCVKSLCHSCNEELRIESVYGYIREIRYH